MSIKCPRSRLVSTFKILISIVMKDINITSDNSGDQSASTGVDTKSRLWWRSRGSPTAAAPLPRRSVSQRWRFNSEHISWTKSSQVGEGGRGGLVSRSDVLKNLLFSRPFYECWEGGGGGERWCRRRKTAKSPCVDFYLRDLGCQLSPRCWTWGWTAWLWGRGGITFWACGGKKSYDTFETKLKRPWLRQERRDLRMCGNDLTGQKV